MGDDSSTAVHDAAERGTRGAGGALPHLDTIQKSFGHHDVGGVNAHTGSDASEAARSIGAEAFATGNDVAFGDTPSLHTAAHEAAHVVQQRSGVHLKGGVGQEGDPYEQHADAVADAVVAGRSAESLLDTHVGTGAASSRAVMRKETDTKHDEAKSKASPKLPDGVNHRLNGTSGDQLVRSAWFLKGSTTSGTQVRNPERMKELNAELRQLFWWMSDAQVEASKDQVIGGPIETEFFTAKLTTSTFRNFGLPPGTDIVWKKEADGGLSLILSIRNAGIEQPPTTDTSTFRIDDALRARIDAQFEKTFGVVPKSPMLPRDTLTTKPSEWAWVIRYTRNQVTTFVGAEWAHAKNANAGADDPASAETSAFGGLTFPNYIPIADREYYVHWMEVGVGKAVPSGGAGAVEIDDDLIRAMRQLDDPKQKLLKEKVLDRLRASAGSSGFVLDATSFRRFVHETREEQERLRLGLQQPAPEVSVGNEKQKPYTSPRDVQVAPRSRYYEREITGKLINLGSLASVGKSMDMYFSTEDPQGIGFVGVTVDWLVTPMGDPTTHVREGRTFNYAHHDPEKWSVSFDKVGKYEITARVDHQSYWPTTFKSSVEVKTEDDRLKQVEKNSFGNLGDDTKTTDDQHFFDVSFSNDRFGANKYTFGSVREGKLPKDFTPQTLDEHLGFMKHDRDALNNLIKTYEGKDDRQSRDVVSYAKAARDRLDTSEKKIRDDGKDLVPFEVRGAFLSEKNGVRSGDLTLIGLAGSRKKTATDVQDVAKKGTTWNQPTVRIHDMSQLYEPKSAVYTGEADDFRASAEKAFVDLCKSYPPGRVSLLMEQVTPDGQRTGQTLGFELHTGTAWKGAKEVVWDGKVQLVVNLAGAAAAIFLPGAGAVIAMALVTAYNATDTIDNLAALERKGQATRFDYGAAFAQIGLDIVPFAGELKTVGKLSKTTLFAISAAQVATTAVVFTAEGVTEVRALRDEQIQRTAKLQQEVDELRKNSDSSLELKAKEHELQESITEAQQIANKVFAKMASQGLVMLMAPLAFNHMLEGFAHTSAHDFAKSDLFVEGSKGETPHYNAETGKVHGDSSMLTPDLTAKLNEAWTLDVYAKHADAANVLGVKTHEVVIKRDPKATKTTAVKNKEGIWEITTPEKETQAHMLDELWRERQKQPDAPVDRPTALERGSYEPTFSIDELLQIGKPVIVGNRIENRGDAEAILRKLAAGDHAALKDIGFDKLPKAFDPRSIEWGLGVMPDGKYIIIRGNHGRVDWSPFPEVRPIAHSHPLRSNKMLRADGGAPGIHILDMVKGGGVNEHNRVDFFPSAGDVAFCVHNALATHFVQTPYVHVGNGVVGNPVGDFADKPRISVEVRGAQRIGSWEGIEKIPAYQAHVVVRDAAGTVIWEGEMIAVDHPAVGSHIQFGEPPAHWLKPGLASHGMGGETAAALRKPRTKFESEAWEDWQKLEKSGKKYGGKFDGEEWYARYEDGLHYDLDGERWVRPDGRKAKDPQKFDKRSWTKEKVYDHLAGPESESTFKPFAEMLIREKIATRKQIEKMIEEKGFYGRDEDMVRHELKQEYRKDVVAEMMKPRTPEEKHAAMRRITEKLDSSDKGNITEVWYQEAILGGSGERHVAANKRDLSENQGIEITKNRFIDIVDGNIGRELKSGEGKLSDGDILQMRDNARLVDGRARLQLDSGEATIEHVRYTFASPAGARANVETMKLAFTDKNLTGRISFELFTPEGKKLPPIKTLEQLNAQRWLFQ